MTRRVAALFGLFAFAVAWLVGVWCGHAPMTRLENAAIALASGFCAGLGVGVALERIVLARLAENWQENEAAPASSGARPAANPNAQAGNVNAPSGVGAGAIEPEVAIAGGEAKR